MDKFSVKEGFRVKNSISNFSKKVVSKLTPSGRERDFERALSVVFSPDDDVKQWENHQAPSWKKPVSQGCMTLNGCCCPLTAAGCLKKQVMRVQPPWLWPPAWPASKRARLHCKENWQTHWCPPRRFPECSQGPGCSWWPRGGCRSCAVSRISPCSAPDGEFARGERRNPCWSPLGASVLCRIQTKFYSFWLSITKSQQAWVRSQHPPTQWNVRGGSRSLLLYFLLSFVRRNKNLPFGIFRICILN